MRKRLSYANVTATLALVFAMSGGAMAANHYLITSTKQINPKVLKKLTGKTGKTGATGARPGATGRPGRRAKTGPAVQRRRTGAKKDRPGERIPATDAACTNSTTYGRSRLHVRLDASVHTEAASRR